VFGRGALEFPERGIGIDRFRERRQKLEDALRRHQQAAQTQAEDEVRAQIRKLSELHDEGVLTDEEFEAKKAELLSRLA
jgi:glucose-6-phosphate-specific signal transduction histidine kinase